MLTKSNKRKDQNIDELKGQLEFWWNKFNKVINFIKVGFFYEKNREKYYNISVDLYE
jgi:hypothetical protein